MKKLYRTVFRFEVLSEEPINDSLSIEEIEKETRDGDWSGRMLDSEPANQVLTGKEAVAAVQAQGSDPSFFQMDDNGNEIDD